MAHTFVTDEEVKQHLAAMLKTDAAKLPAYWSLLIVGATNTAYGQIVSQFMNRGFSRAQIENWNQGAEYQRDLALYWCLVRGGGLHNYDDKFIARLNRLEEMKSIQLETESEPQEQAGSPPVISAGSLNDTKDRYKTVDF